MSKAIGIGKVGRAILGVIAVLLIFGGIGVCASGGEYSSFGCVAIFGILLLWLSTRPQKKRCPECAEEIDARARRCKHCGQQLA